MTEETTPGGERERKKQGRLSVMDIYEKLARHLSALGMGYPVKEELIEILKENFTAQEAEVALAIPNTPTPLQPVEVKDILAGIPLSRKALVAHLERLAHKGLIFSGTTQGGERGYALHQVGYGFPQTFFWGGQESPHAVKMARLVARYFNRETTEEAYSPSETKPYRYIPVGRTLETGKQAVLPFHMIEHVVEQATTLAVAHCPCRMAYTLNGRRCDHPTEVCLKFNDLARYVIERGLAREVTREEALEIVRRAEEAGLVHFVDNAEGDIQHNCNCCGCACWNVGNIRRRRIPRDVLMATYFIRETDEEECSGCGACVDVCPVLAVGMEGDLPRVDTDWCIGCGVCGTVCPTGAARVVLRPDRSDRLPAREFRELHTIIRREKGSGGRVL
jgi:ferredoxin